MKAGVLIVSNDKTIFDFIKPKLVLLRNNDNIYEADYNDALDVIDKYSPQIVILNCGYDLHAFSELLKRIKIPVVACFENINPEYLLTAYDYGIADFITRKSTSEEILARVMSLLKTTIVIEKKDAAIDILKNNQIIDELGFFSSPEKVYPYFLNRYDTGTFVIFSVQETLDNRIQKIISESLRESDIKAQGIGNIYYVFMPFTDIDGAVAVVKKIISKAEGLAVYAGICSHYGNKDFHALNNILENALNVAVASKKEYIIIDDNLTPSSNWIEKISSNKKNFKLFKQEFNKMLEQVLTPVFYQVQAKYETRFYNTKIVHSITPELSVFKIMGEFFDSEFKLRSSGFSAITIDIIHNTDEKKITIDINDLEPKTLEVLLEEFVEEHRMYMEEKC